MNIASSAGKSFASRPCICGSSLALRMNHLSNASSISATRSLLKSSPCSRPGTGLYRQLVHMIAQRRVKLIKSLLHFETGLRELRLHILMHLGDVSGRVDTKTYLCVGNQTSLTVLLQVRSCHDSQPIGAPLFLLASTAFLTDDAPRGLCSLRSSERRFRRRARDWKSSARQIRVHIYHSGRQ